MDLNWFHLPEHLWITILQQLNVKTLLKLSETCSTFNNLLFNTILSKELKLFINLRRDEHLVNIFKHSNRKYRSVMCFHFNEYLDDSFEDFEVMLDILNRFSDSIREIQLDGFQLSCYNWNRLIQTLKNVDAFELSHVFVDNIPNVPLQITTKIDLLSMDSVDNEIKVDLFDSVSVKKVKLAGHKTNENELFLLKHEELKSLNAGMSTMFVNDTLSNVKFSLKYLDLYHAKWSNKQHALNFIRTQTKLRRVYLSLAKDQYDILFLKHIMNNNSNLSELLVELNGKCVKLFQKEIHKINDNYFISHFYFKCFPENPSLSKRILSLFPNSRTRNDHFLFHVKKSYH